MLFIYYYFLIFFLFHSVNSWKTIHKKGFFGMIGIKDIDNDKKQSIYEVFTKDGILQGVFLDTDKNGNQIFHTIKQPINTQKIIWNIEFPSNILTTMIIGFIRFISCNKINLLGRANTALMSNENNKLYALYERDLPYEMNIDFKEKTVSDGKRKWINGIKYFSAHSKLRIDENKNNVIDSIEYNVMEKQVIHHVISHDFKKLINKNVMNSFYLPFIHDFSLLRENKNTQLVWIDSPFTFSLNNGLNFPIGLDKNKPTIIHVGNDLYTLQKSICIFHIAYVEETEKVIDIYTSIYYKINFSEDIKNISGVYCCIRLYKGSQYAELILNEELEKYNLDFPIVYENNIILRNIDNKTKMMNGFMIVNKLEIIKKIIFEKDMILLGEPIVIYDEKIPYLIFFTKDKQNNYIMKINLLNDEMDKQEINKSFNMGFHSIWINDSTQLKYEEQY